MSINASEVELKSFSESQKDINVRSDNDVTLGEEVMSDFYQDFHRTLWSSSMKVKIESSSNSNTITYTIPDRWHLILYSYRTCVTPLVKIKPEYIGKVRIAWTHNLADNHVESASFFIDSISYHNLDSVSLDIDRGFYGSKNYNKNKMAAIHRGNNAICEKWSESFIPPFELMVEDNWFYSQSGCGLPIMYNNGGKFCHKYTFVPPEKLLRVQFKDEDRWINVTNTQDYVTFEYTDSFSVPEFYARLVRFPNENLDWWYECLSEYKVYIRNYINYDTTKIYKYGDTEIIDIDSDKPCIAVFWLAQNHTAATYHLYSNYTTDSQNVSSGWDPILHSSLKYKKENDHRFKELPSKHSSFMEAFKHFPTIPEDFGYHAESIAYNSVNYNGDINLIMKNLGAQLICTFNTPNSDEESPLFKLKVRGLALRKLTITQDDKGNFKYNLD